MDSSKLFFLRESRGSGMARFFDELFCFDLRRNKAMAATIPIKSNAQPSAIKIHAHSGKRRKNRRPRFGQVRNVEAVNSGLPENNFLVLFNNFCFAQENSPGSVNSQATRMYLCRHSTSRKQRSFGPFETVSKQVAFEYGVFVLSRGHLSSFPSKQRDSV